MGSRYNGRAGHMEKEMSFQEIPSNREISFCLGEEHITAFLVKGFFQFSANPSPFHRHHYAEIHLMEWGEADYRFSGQMFHLQPYELLLIPAGQFHEACGFSAASRHIAFQTSWPVSEVKKISYSPEKTKILFEEIERYCQSSSSAGVCAALGMVFAAIMQDADTTRSIRDTDFLIDDFFDHNYQNNAHLEELARILRLSTKQAARLVFRLTGRTFREEITHRRMEAARQLMKDQSLSLTQIAEKVGYQSYSGFWKAFHDQQTPREDRT